VLQGFVGVESGCVFSWLFSEELFASLDGEGLSLAAALAEPLTLVYLAGILIFLSSAFFRFLGAVQAFLLLLSSCVLGLLGAKPFLCLVFSGGAVLVLARRGFFARHAALKAGCLGGAFMVASIMPLLLAGMRPGRLVAAGLASAANALALAALASERWRTILIHGRKEVLRLGASALTAKELELVREFLSGSSMKELSRRHNLAFSTVRNFFSSVYAKLGISGSAELLALRERYSIDFERPGGKEAPPGRDTEA
jgi:DNA-binding CsgD family transcriptional regulator